MVGSQAVGVRAAVVTLSFELTYQVCYNLLLGAGPKSSLVYYYYTALAGRGRSKSVDSFPRTPRLARGANKSQHLGGVADLYHPLMYVLHEELVENTSGRRTTPLSKLSTNRCSAINSTYSCRIFKICTRYKTKLSCSCVSLQ